MGNNPKGGRGLATIKTKKKKEKRSTRGAVGSREIGGVLKISLGLAPQFFKLPKGELALKERGTQKPNQGGKLGRQTWWVWGDAPHGGAKNPLCQIAVVR